MPLLDMSDVLLDPDFIDSFTYVRTVETVNENGYTQSTQETNSGFGTVTSDAGKKVIRDASGERAIQTIFIVTLTRLLSIAMTTSADVVTWNGLQYTVVDIGDYTRYGAGFVQAKCELLPVTG